MAKKTAATVAAPVKARKPNAEESALSPTRLRPSSLLDTRVVYCGDNLDQLKKLPDACVDLIYIDPAFNSNRNYEVFWGSPREITQCAAKSQCLRRITGRDQGEARL